MGKRTIITVVVTVFLLGVAIFQGFLKKEKPVFTIIEVARGNVTQEVSETGQVKKGEEINLSFKNTGRIERVYVVVGKELKAGDILARLDVSQLTIQIEEAKAALSLAQSQLNKLLAGATTEEIKISQTEVQNKILSLNTANQNLQNAYESSLNVLNDAYLKAYNAQNFVNTLQRTYFFSSDQEEIRVKESKEKIKNSVSLIKSYLDQVQATFTFENTDQALSQIRNELSNISASLKIVRESCETLLYRDVVSSANKTSLETHQSNVNTVLTSVINSQQSIVSDRLAVESAEGNLQAAQDSLALITAPARKEDVEYYQAQTEQVRAQVSVLENQIQDSYLRAPVGGQIVEIKKKTGELAQPVPQDVVMTMLPFVPYEIKVDVYEENVVKINVGNPVEISLVAFPKKTFKGKITSISPAEKTIEAVVYYEITINFEEVPENIKPGMTADVVIKTASKENVLTVSQDVIQNKEGKTIIEVLKGEKFEEREIEIGLRGSNDMVEVISGLEKGEKVIIR